MRRYLAILAEATADTRFLSGLWLFESYGH
jgi:hypothetical protein